MSKLVLLGIENEERMLLVDCDNLTVDEVDVADVAGIAGERAAGKTAFRGVDTAIVASQRSQASSHPYLEKH